MRERDIGGSGHLYHAVTVELLDIARVAWLHRFVSADLVEQYVVANLDITYRREVTRADRELTVCIRVQRIGTSSLTLHEEMTNPDGLVVATCRTTIVAFMPYGGASRPLTRAEIARAESFRADVALDT
nr:acyl-CoA thioesterase [Gordonia sp. SID5947]